MSDLPATKPDRRKPPTAAEVRAVMRRRFCDPQDAILFEVRDATGHSGTRSADAITMGLWPSRGLYLSGYEIKVDKYDWRREQAKPEKAETIAAYCDFWWLVAAPGVVGNISEIPPNWGWMECDGEQLTQLKPAIRLTAKTIDRPFLASLMRSAHRVTDADVEAEIVKRDRDREQRFEERVKTSVDRRLHDRDQVLKDVEAFEAAAGIKISEFRGWDRDAAEMGRIFKAIRASKIDATWDGLFAMADRLRKAAETVDQAMTDHGFDRPAAPADLLDAHLPRRRKKAAAS